MMHDEVLQEPMSYIHSSTTVFWNELFTINEAVNIPHEGDVQESLVTEVMIASSYTVCSL